MQLKHIKILRRLRLINGCNNKKKLQIAGRIILNPTHEKIITRLAAHAHINNNLEYHGGKIDTDQT
ncbi:hypothetical protein L2D98_24685, partial [Salmonella enterica subsp. enterica serovar Weltevreden]|nr:hypothetical protein [Salmonella enterica subsp. enterica serovar Weltevreden]